MPFTSTEKSVVTELPDGGYRFPEPNILREDMMNPVFRGIPGRPMDSFGYSDRSG